MQSAITLQVASNIIQPQVTTQTRQRRVEIMPPTAI